MSRGPEAKQSVMSARQIGRKHLFAASEAWHFQVSIIGHDAHMENPLTSDAWKLLKLGQVYDLRVDQCALGLRCPKTNLPVLKPTRLVTSSNALAQALRNCRCDHKHEHAHLVGKFRGRNLTSYAESYPAKFCRAVSKALITCAEEIHAGELDDISVNSEDNRRSRPGYRG